MYKPNALAFLPILFFLAGAYGCKDGCEDVLCAPAPPLLTVAVQDTITIVNVVSADSVDTVVVTRRTPDARVSIHGFSSGVTGPVLDAIPFGSDTMFFYNDLSRLQADTFALVAVRGNRADTVVGLSLKHVEGCCPFDVIGHYTISLPKE